MSVPAWQALALLLADGGLRHVVGNLRLHQLAAHAGRLRLLLGPRAQHRQGKQVAHPAVHAVLKSAAGRQSETH
jgi:hypothetical protein